MLRRLTHIGWLGSGWPEWVAGPDRAEDFDREINELQSLCYLAMIALNLLPGLFVDFCKKKFYKPENETYGIGVGLAICFTLSAFGMTIHRYDSSYAITYFNLSSVLCQLSKASQWQLPVCLSIPLVGRWERECGIRCF